MNTPHTFNIPYESKWSQRILAYHDSQSTVHPERQLERSSNENSRKFQTPPPRYPRVFTTILCQPTQINFPYLIRHSPSVEHRAIPTGRIRVYRGRDGQRGGGAKEQSAGISCVHRLEMSRGSHEFLGRINVEYLFRC